MYSTNFTYKTVGIWQYCFSKHSSPLKVSPHLVPRYRSCVRRQSYRGPSDAVADRVEEIWIGLLKSKPGVEIRKNLSIKSSLLFWQNLGSLNTQNTCYPGSISITQSSTPSLIWISILVFYWLIISLLCSLNANNTSTRLTTLSSLCEHVDNEYVAV